MNLGTNVKQNRHVNENKMKAKTANKNLATSNYQNLFIFTSVCMFHYLWKMQSRMVELSFPLFKCNKCANYLRGAEIRSSEGGLAVELQLKNCFHQNICTCKKAFIRMLIIPKKQWEKNRCDLRSNPRLYFLIANVDKNLGEIVIEEV